MAMFLVYAGYGKSISSYYSDTFDLLAALNYDTSGKSLVDDTSMFTQLNQPGIDGNGEFTVGFVKSHVIPSAGGVAPFTITSTLDDSENQTFKFNRIACVDMYVMRSLIIGDAYELEELVKLDHIGEHAAIAFSPESGGYINAIIDDEYFNPPSDDYIPLPTTALMYGLTQYLEEIFEESPSLEYVDLYLPILIDLTVDEAYIQSKLAGKYVDIDASIKPAGHNDDELGGVYVPYASQSGLSLDTSDGELKIDPSWVSSMLAGQGLIASNSRLSLANASDTTVGGIKIKVINGACYITTNGSTPGQ